ncbi:DUF1543 domain-containing protein [Sphingobacterium shayense]|uniref:DUF1543 domain-containing protein n=1 Tax=Sphingobacterium shayense TaxID=626343 RepID=UPI0015541235|nr:DUF1543 domain-containing protein [Sphingobacterium shayense]NQD69851.1 DUF1543 domain-containing protein [Sphingobacterium shayense]
MSKDLFMVLLGCKPEGRFTEQHDIYFGIANELPELKNEMIEFWPEARGKLHVDAWKRVTHVEGYQITVVPRDHVLEQTKKLFFVNLGGYREHDFEEYHFKQLIAADTLQEASKLAKQTTFFANHISPHIDDKYGLDVDDVYDVEDILDPLFRTQYKLNVLPVEQQIVDHPIIGYLKFSDL